jgi:hypothetical protein
MYIGYGPTLTGHVQLADSAGTPLLWAGSATYDGTWLSFSPGDPVCSFLAECSSGTRNQVLAKVNGTVAIIPPFSAANVGDYYVAAGEYNVVQRSHLSDCSAGPPPLAAAAVKLQ